MSEAEERAKLRALFAGSVRPGENGCLIWRGLFMAGDLPGFTVPGASGPTSARRWLWLDEGHRDPGRQQVLNRCDDKRCVNPDHSYIANRDKEAS